MDNNRYIKLKEELLEEFNNNPELLDKFTDDFIEFSEDNYNRRFLGENYEQLKNYEPREVDRIYRELVEDVLKNGQSQSGEIRAHYADGEPAYTTYLPNAITVKFNVAQDLPIISSKPVATKSMLAELDWIWRRMSNNVQELRDAGSTIWDEWEKPFNANTPIVEVKIKPKDDMKCIADDSVDEELRQFNRVGYLDNWESVSVNYSEKQISNLRRLWENMFKKCYDLSKPNDIYVDKKWHSFKDFLETIPKIPQYRFALKDDFNNKWRLDKDYFGKNNFSPDSTVFQHKDSQLRGRPCVVVYPNGDETLHLGVESISKELGISKNSVKKKIDNWTASDPIKIKSYSKEGFILRRSLDFPNIGKAYGYQLAQVSKSGKSQVENVLYDIMFNSSSRRIMTTLYVPSDLEDMALEPCVFLTNWQVDNDNKLHLNVVQRSADLALGVPFNWAQYAVLLQRVAQVTGKEVGEMSWTIFNAHVYNRHIPLLKEQIKEITQTTPVTLKLPESTEFFATPLTDISIENYDPLEKNVKPSERKYRYEVAI